MDGILLEQMVPTMVSNTCYNYPNNLPIRKSVPYPIYIVGIDLDAHVRVFKKAIQANGEKNDFDIVNMLCFTLRDGILEWGKFLCNPTRLHLFAKDVKLSKLMNRFIWH
jgi:hypothetical protein